MATAKKKQDRIEEIDSLYNSVKAFRSTERTGDLLHFVARKKEKSF